jgi:hypothetical protein
MQRKVVEKLMGGDVRSLGRSRRLVDALVRDPSKFDEVFKEIFSDDPVVRVRAADVVEKVTRTRPELLRPFKRTLIERAAVMEDPKVRWQVLPMLVRVRLSAAERDRVREILLESLQSRSSILRTVALQTLWDLSDGDAGMREEVRGVLAEAMVSGSAAMRARARILLRTSGPRPAPRQR